ncbi:unnamed protein product [Didymodactylos carnosus]|uniref:Cytidyltransferase-like domain-containing protein n=1 Tax=Didymodactylos carnosus TaxID=1234261 RepID=A0A814B177_9BILA|nr:unnamed protein product [Didymodactylos carnosus]CAF0921648.1 unnamed protein product [Didymodactylos carnosus]CAF3582999.1 unnamed protein product [Didymodactylos carnosus]CAF3700866.1 unnamed protein product [Didymodactylos carnosus]
MEQLYHSECTTSLQNLANNYSREDKGKQSCVLLSSGAFNPICKIHIANLIQARRYLERDFNVLAGFLSPSHDDWVKHKTANKDWINCTNRINLCELAIRDAKVEKWISVDKAEYNADYFIDFPQLCHSLFLYINRSRMVSGSKLIRVIYVCGFNLYDDCQTSIQTLLSPELNVAVMQGEETVTQYSKQDYLWFFGMDYRQYSEVTEFSQIRERLEQKKACDKITYPSVIDYIKTFCICI